MNHALSSTFVPSMAYGRMQVVKRILMQNRKFEIEGNPENLFSVAVFDYVCTLGSWRCKYVDGLSTWISSFHLALCVSACRDGPI